MPALHQGAGGEEGGADVSESPEYRAEFEAEIPKTGTLALKIKDEGRWLGWLMRHAGRKVTVTLSREKRIRSDAANRYYWGMIVPIFSELTGYEKDEAHELLKYMFLKREVTLPGGEVAEMAGSTAKLDTKQFAEYCDRIVRWMAERGWYVPSPGGAA